MISDRCPFSHMDIEDSTGGFISLNIFKDVEGLIQLLKYFLRLCILELITELIIHDSPHDAITTTKKIINDENFLSLIINFYQ